MTKRLELLVTPLTFESTIKVTHTDELVVLDKVPYNEKLITDYVLPPERCKDFPDIPSPRSNTYVLNIKEIFVQENTVHLYTNYTNMRSQFALRRWLPLLPEGSEERKKILNSILPIGGAMILKTSDEKILIEERGKVEIQGKYNPAPAGGCETRDWQVRPELFRSIKGEAWEETGLLPGQDYNSDVKLIGLVRDQIEAYNPTFTYHANTNLTFDEIKKYAESIAPEAGEHQRLLAAPADFSGLFNFCVREENKMIGNGLGNLLLFGYHQYGETWLAETTARLEEKGWDIINYNKRFQKEVY